MSEEHDQHLIAAIIEFDWPCEKRKPHGSHPLATGWGHVCPGVAAHPATMIGRVSPRGRVEAVSPPDHPA